MEYVYARRVLRDTATLDPWIWYERKIFGHVKKKKNTVSAFFLFSLFTYLSPQQQSQFYGTKKNAFLSYFIFHVFFLFFRHARCRLHICAFLFRIHQFTCISHFTRNNVGTTLRLQYILTVCAK